jgi:hypothetical protein
MRESEEWHYNSVLANSGQTVPVFHFILFFLCSLHSSSTECKEEVCLHILAFPLGTIMSTTEEWYMHMAKIYNPFLGWKLDLNSNR